VAAEASANPEAAELLQLGIAAYRAGDRRRARQLLTAATQRDPRLEQAWLWLSAAHDDLEFRRICLQKVLALNPRNADARRGLQILDGAPPPRVSVFSPPPAGSAAPPAAEPPPRPPAATMRARPSEPILPHCPWCGAEFTRRAQDRCPRCAKPLEVDCPACERPVPLEAESCVHCGQAVGRFFADREGYLSRLGEAYFAQNWVDQALAMYALLLEMAPAKELYHRRTAQLYGQIGDTVASINAYRRVLELSLDDPEALTQLARWYLILHQAPELKEIGQRLRALKQRSPKLTAMLGDIEYELEHYKAAEPIYRELVQRRDLDPETRVRLHFRLGEMARERGDPAGAVRAYSAAVGLGVDGHEAKLAQSRLDALRPPLPEQALRSYGETLRAMVGPVLLVWLTAGLQIGFEMRRLTGVGLVGLVLTVLGSYLLACALVTPQTLEWREALGPAGLNQPVAKTLAAVVGGGLAATALFLVLFGM